MSKTRDEELNLAAYNHSSGVNNMAMNLRASFRAGAAYAYADSHPKREETPIDSCQKCEKLRDRAERLRTALEVYAMTDESFPEYKNVASEVLKADDELANG